MSETRIGQVRSLVLEIERLKAELSKLDEGLAAHERELSALLGDAPSRVANVAHVSPGPKTRIGASAPPSTARHQAGSGAHQATAVQPTIKDTILNELREHPEGVELGALTSVAYSDDSKANRKRCEKLLYKLASARRVTHTGPVWAIAAGQATGHPAATHTSKATGAEASALPRFERGPREYTAAKSAGAAVKPQAKTRNWPKCSVEGCGKSSFGPSAARRLCFQHFRDAGGKHYSKQ